MKQLYFFSLVISLLFQTKTKAQNFDFLEAFRLGDGEGLNSEVMHILSFQNNDLLILGKFRGLYDFDLDPIGQALIFSASNSGGQFMARYTPEGALVWVKPIISPSQVNFYGATIDSADNIFITGSFSPAVSFTPGNPAHTFVGVSPNNANGFVARFNSQGDFQWMRMFSGTSVDTGFDIAINPQGELIVLGQVSQTVQFEAGNPSSVVVSAGAADVFVAAYTPTGQFLWVSSIPGNGFDNARSLALDSRGFIYVLGDFTSTIVFPSVPPVPTVSTGGNDVFIARFNPNGVFEWGRKIGGNSTDLGSHAILVGDTMLVINGTYRLNMQFDHGGTTPLFTTPNSNADVFMAAYDTSGSYLWNVRFGSSGADGAFRMALGDSSKIWTTGYIATTADLDPGVGVAPIGFNSLGNPFLAAYDAHSGIFHKAYTPESQLFTTYQTVHQSPNGFLYAGGRFRGAMDLNPNGQPFTITTPNTNRISGFWARYHTDFDTAWHPEIRGGGDDEIRRVAHDAQGNLYLAGVFKGTLDFDRTGTAPTLRTAIDGTDCFVASYTHTGSLRWVQIFGGPGEDLLTAFKIDPAGNVWLGGHFFDAFLMPNANGFDTLTPVPSGIIPRPDIFLIKLNNNGAFLWGHQLGGSNDDFIKDFAFFANGDAVITGDFRGGIDFDPLLLGQNTITGNNSAAYFARYTAQGQYLWSKLINGPSTQFGEAIATDQLGNIFVTGAHRGTTEFDAGPGTFTIASSTGTEDVFVAKYAPNGNFIWAKAFGSNAFERGYGIATDDHHNAYLTGSFASTIDFNPGGTPLLATSNGNTDVFVLKLSPSGTTQWLATFGGTGSDLPMDLKIAADKIYTTGAFLGTVDFHTGTDSLFETSAGLEDVFVHVMDTAGNFFNAATFGGINNDRGMGISHFAGNTHVVGYFLNEMDANPGLQTFVLGSLGGRDGFMVKLGNAGPCPTVYDTLSIAACDVYAWNNEVFTTSGNYTRVFASAIGCDSLVTVQLALGDSYSNLQITTSCGGYFWNGRTITQTGVYTDSLQTTTGCDSVLTLDLVVDTGAFVMQNVTACNSFFWQGQTLNQSGFYTDSLLTSNGCDSVYNLQLTIDAGFFDTQNVTACNSYNWRGQAFTQSGFYTDSLLTSNGCDSVFNLQLTIDAGFFDTQNVTACNSYNWRGQIYTQSGVYTDSLLTSNGCDSVFNLQLTIDAGFYNFQQIAVCESIVWNGQLVTQSGLYTDSLLNGNGCDSVWAALITVETVNVQVMRNAENLTAQMTGAQYQWLDCDAGFSPIAGANQQVYTVLANGSYAVEISNGSCIDTSLCFVYTNISADENAALPIAVYPNPSNGLFAIAFPFPLNNVAVTLISSSGGIVAPLHNGPVAGLQYFAVDVPSGVYVLHIQHPTFQNHIRLVVVP